MLQLGLSAAQAHAKTMPAPRPRDAATLILVRRDSAQPAILMGRRSGGHDFMPGKWVFPGGRIDRADYRAAALSELRAEVAEELAATARLSRQDGARLARVAESAQVLVVTHSPQVAAAGAHHFRISKAAGRTEIFALQPEDRRDEIARMLSGAEVTAEARAQAERLLAG